MQPFMPRSWLGRRITYVPWSNWHQMLSKFITLSKRRCASYSASCFRMWQQMTSRYDSLQMYFSISFSRSMLLISSYQSYWRSLRMSRSQNVLKAGPHCIHPWTLSSAVLKSSWYCSEMRARTASADVASKNASNASVNYQQSILTMN